MAATDRGVFRRLGTGYSVTAPSERFLAIVPRMWKGGEGKRAVVVAPGAGGTALGAVWDDIDEIARAGYPVVAADMGGAGWGATYARVGEAWEFAIDELGAEADKVHLVGTSMGFATVANWAVRNASDVASCNGVIPLVSLLAFYETLSADQRVTVQNAYGGLLTWEAEKADHDPLTRADDFTFPTALWAASSDTLVPFTYAQQFAAVNGAQLTDLGVGNHFAPPLDHQQLIAFMEAADL